MSNLRMEKLINECDKHLQRISRAYTKMALFMPLDASRYNQLSDDEVADVDQFLFRFSKLQDAMGEKLFVLMLEFLKEENPKSKPFIDTLNRLEQLGLLKDKNIWLELRKIRNNIAPQYEDEPKQASEALNAIYAVKPTLESIYQRIKTRYISIRDSLAP
ncbi:MAG: hypothetical protein WCP01_04495 [Methylococcaceae bacterium]|jgi:hypothetical protein